MTPLTVEEPHQSLSNGHSGSPSKKLVLVFKTSAEDLQSGGTSQ